MLFLKPPYATMFFVLNFIVHYLLHVLAPIGGHLQVKCTQNIYYGDHCDHGSVDIHSGHPNIYFVYILPADGHRLGPKHVVSSTQ
jgi:hypothetical protein